MMSFLSSFHLLPLSIEHYHRRLARLAGLALLLAACLPTLQFSMHRPRAHAGSAPPVAMRSALARISDDVSIHAAGRGAPFINLSDGHNLITNYKGEAKLISALEQEKVRPLSLASADFDEDGVPDLVSGYAHDGGGIVTTHRGNVDAIYPNAPEAQQRRAAGQYTDAPFLSPAQAFSVAATPDFIGTGDFDSDGHWDLTAVSRGGRVIHFLSGDGRGDFRPPVEIELPGGVTAMTTGEVNRADGLTDIVVAVDTAAGPQALVFEGPRGAFKGAPDIIALPEVAHALALGQLDDEYPMDLAVAAGHTIMLVHGRDRELLKRETVPGNTQPAVTEEREFSTAVRSLAIGDFTGSRRPSLAILSDNGGIQLLSPSFDGGELQGVRQEIAAWKKVDASSGSWKGATQLVSARVSSAQTDNLLVIDPTGRPLHVLLKQDFLGDSPQLLNELPREPLSFDLAHGAPVAVLPMRLTGDALQSLVILNNAQSTPSVMEPQAAMTFVVNSTLNNDDGACNVTHCSLIEALNASNNNPGMDRIEFRIGTGVQTIVFTQPGSFNPRIMDPVTIDATTQPGFAGRPLIELNGTGGAANEPGLLSLAGNSTVRGLIVNRVPSDGITLFSGSGNIIEGNYLGTDVTGTTALPNQNRGVGIGEIEVHFQSSNNRIGGTTPQARNVISGNLQHGVRILGLNSTNNDVQGNFVGTDFTGTLSLGNRCEGVVVGGGLNNTVGGTVAGAGNLISANAYDCGSSRTSGVGITTFPIFIGAAGNRIQGNLIGTKIDGLTALGNANEGVVLENGATSNTVGGTTSTARNIISGNGTNGVDIGFERAVIANQVVGNYIGVNVSGVSPLGNGGSGIFVNANSDNNVIRDNEIAYNGVGGVRIPNVPPNPGAPGVRIAIDTNSIYLNNGLGIDLGETGVTLNDLLDTDEGANFQQNFPVLTAVTPGVSAADEAMPAVSQPPGDGSVPLSPAATLTVGGTLNSTASTTFTVHWYFSEDAQCTSNQFDERPLAFGRVADVTTNAQGDAQFSFPFSFPPGINGGVINCTATDPNGNTSEFSSCFPVMAPPVRTLTVASVNPSSNVSITVSPNDNSGQGTGTTQFARTYDHGATVTLTAPPTVSGNSFQKWQRDGVDWATTAATSLTMDANRTMTAVYLSPIQVTVGANPSGRSFAVDGTTYSTTQMFSWVPGSTHNISTTSPQSGGTGTQYVWSNWSDGGVISHSVSPTTNTTYTANFTTQHLLTMNAGEGGTVSPASGFYNSGQTVSISATANAGFIFSGWTGSGSGSFTGSSNPASVTMNEPVTETASFTATPTPTPTPTPMAIQFSAGTANAIETLNATTKLDLTVTRTGSTSGAASVKYASSDGTANQFSDYLAALGTLRFAAGETTKTISVFIVDDAFGETSETFNLTLSDPVGGSLGAPATITVTINSNETMDGPNPVKDPSFSSDFFVRQHYVDFFNREADPPGLGFWKNQIDECTTQACREIRRINVSAAFFVSGEFQQTGYLVYKAYQAAFSSGEQLPLQNFLPDTQEIGRGVIFGAPGAEQQLETNKQNFFLDFVQRPAFLSAYPTTLPAMQFVEMLNANTLDPLAPGAGPSLTPTEKQALIDQLAVDPTSPSLRAQVLRSVSENGVFHQRQFNKAFVLMQYFGYLRRNPNAAPDTNFAGYNFWLGKLNQFNGNFVEAEMVKAFITSGEYQQRFGP